MGAGGEPGTIDPGLEPGLGRPRGTGREVGWGGVGRGGAGWRVGAARRPGPGPARCGSSSRGIRQDAGFGSQGWRQQETPGFLSCRQIREQRLGGPRWVDQKADSVGQAWDPFSGGGPTLGLSTRPAARSDPWCAAPPAEPFGDSRDSLGPLRPGSQFTWIRETVSLPRPWSSQCLTPTSLKGREPGSFPHCLLF